MFFSERGIGGRFIPPDTSIFAPAVTGVSPRIAAMGVPTLDGLGVDGAGAHAEHEHIVIDDIPRRAALLTRLMQTV